MKAVMQVETKMKSTMEVVTKMKPTMEAATEVGGENEIKTAMEVPTEMCSCKPVNQLTMITYPHIK